MKKQDLVKLAVLGMMGVGATLGAQQPQAPQKVSPPVQGQQGPNWSHSCGGGNVNSNYSSSDKSNSTGGPSNTQVPTGSQPAAGQFTCSAATQQGANGQYNNGYQGSSGAASCHGDNGSQGYTGGGSCGANNGGNSQPTRVNRYR